MKIFFLKTGTAISIAFLIACSGGGTPKNVATDFLSHYSKLDFDGAKKYGTEETGKLLDMYASFAKMMPDSLRQKDKAVKTEIVSEKIEGDKATVVYKEEGKDGDQVLNMVKVGGQWKVAMSKDNMNGAENTMDSGATISDTTNSGELSAHADSTR